jgi:hypothetical protein
VAPFQAQGPQCQPSQIRMCVFRPRMARHRRSVNCFVGEPFHTSSTLNMMMWPPHSDAVFAVTLIAVPLLTRTLLGESVRRGETGSLMSEFSVLPARRIEVDLVVVDEGGR